MDDKSKLHGLPIHVKKYAICAGCQTCIQMDEAGAFTTDLHYIAVEDITDEYLTLITLPCNENALS
jgi:coenzyme F420-reducing hydrogenase beta subunit